MEFYCPHCQLLMSDDGTHSGQEGVCPQCAGRFICPSIPLPHPNLLTVVSVNGSGQFNIDVVGESHYQQQLTYLCGGKKYESADLTLTAQLNLEDRNPNDPKAVRVDIRGSCVGYVSRDYARKLRHWLKQHKLVNVRTVECQANICGGWYRGPGNEGHFGVTLDIVLRKPK